MRFTGRTLRWLLPVLLILSTAALMMAQGANMVELTKKAEGGDAVAQFDLGYAYFVGSGGKAVLQDETSAAHWFRAAAEQGHAKAQYAIGAMYASGHGVPKNETEAVHWYRKAADQGNTFAQFDLGGMYRIGEGVPKDESEAAHWYRKAADQGDANAQYAIGVMFVDGTGVPKNAAEGVRWYRKAADQGHAKAQWFLGLMYSFGEGVPKDDAEAYFWMNLGGSHLVEGAEGARLIRDEVGKRLAPAKRLEIQERCRKWAEAHPQSHE